MDLKVLLSDSSRRTADMAVAIIGHNPDRFKEMLNFAFEDTDPFAMRAARVVNMVALKHPRLIRPHLHRIVDALPGFRNNGLKRGMLKTLSEHRYDYPEETLGKLIDSCFMFVNDPAEKAAVKIYALDLLVQASRSYPGIRHELITTIEYILPYSSRGIESKGTKLLRKLYREEG